MIAAARILAVIGVALLLIAGLLYVAGRLGLHWGRLPGDIRIQRNDFTCIIGLGTSLLLSILLTVALNLLARLLKK